MQNHVVTERRAYEAVLARRGRLLRQLRNEGMTVYRMAKITGLTRRSIDEAIARYTPAPSEDPLA